MPNENENVNLNQPVQARARIRDNAFPNQEFVIDMNELARAMVQPRPIGLPRDWGIKKIETASVVDNLEKLFIEVLSSIEEIYGSSVEPTIAGGSVRDLAAGIPSVKDIDVFVNITWETFSKNMDELGWKNPPILIKGHDEYKADKTSGEDRFTSSARAQGRFKGISVDLIFLNKPLSPTNVSEFPIHAQRGVYTLEGGLSLSPEMKKDIDNKTFTVSPLLVDENKKKAALEKIGEWKKRPHYKDWKTIQTRIKQWWEKENDDFNQKKKAG